MKKIYYSLIFSLALSCAKPSFESPVEKTINISNCTDTTVFLSEITNQIRYVALDVPQEYMNPLGGDVSIHLSNKNIFYSAMYSNEGNSLPWTEICLIFDYTTGKYISHIGGTKEWEIPNSLPEFYNHIRHSAVILDERGEHILSMKIEKTGESYPNFLQMWDIKTQKYLYTVKDEKKLSNDFGIGIDSYLWNNTFITFYKNSGTAFDKIHIYNTNGKLINTIPHEHKFTPFNKQSSTLRISSYKTDSLYYYADYNANKIYAIDKRLHHFSIYKLDFGINTPPYYYNDQIERNKYDNEKYINIRDVIGNDDHIFIKYFFNNTFYFGLYKNKEDKLLVHNVLANKSSHLSENGIPNDIDGGLPFWPTSVNMQGELIAYYPSDSLRNRIQKTEGITVKNPDSRIQLKKMLDSASQKTPIIAIIQTK